MTDVAPIPDPAAQPDPAAPAPDPQPQADPAPAEAPTPAVQAGAVVAHHWTDPTGDQVAYGMVVAVHSDPDTPDRAEVVWFTGRSGPITVDQLEVVKD